MNSFELVKNKLWKIEVPPECGTHFHIKIKEFIFNLNNNEIIMDLNLTINKVYSHDFSHFLEFVIKKDRLDKIIINSITFGVRRTKSLLIHLKEIAKTLNKKRSELEFILKINDVRYSKYKLTDIDKDYNYTFLQIK